MKVSTWKCYKCKTQAMGTGNKVPADNCVLCGSTIWTPGEPNEVETSNAGIMMRSGDEPKKEFRLECKGCGKPPEEIKEYVTAAKAANITPDQYVRQEEGTLNHITGKFYCTRCYIIAGMPLGTA